MDDPTPSPDPLLLTIRFSASIPDLPLEIASPKATTTIALKQLIRSHLPSDLSTHRLRLIHAGKGLSDNVPLSTSLKLPPRPPPPRSSPIHDSSDPKGKAPIRDPPTPRIYIHCSIGDVVLSPLELATEASLATSSSQNGRFPSLSREQKPTTSTTPAPRGFDRLLSSGFTPAEVASLRSQFLAIQAETHTPDTMPSASEMRALEDRWIDSGDSGGGGSVEDEGNEGALEDMLWGAVMGFFWPVGAGVWMLREEGVWSWRRKTAVCAGLLTNFVFGVVRFTS